MKQSLGIAKKGTKWEKDGKIYEYTGKGIIRYDKKKGTLTERVVEGGTSLQSKIMATPKSIQEGTGPSVKIEDLGNNKYKI